MFRMRHEGVLELILETNFFKEVRFASRIVRHALARQIQNCSILEDVRWFLKVRRGFLHWLIICLQLSVNQGFLINFFYFFSF